MEEDGLGSVSPADMDVLNTYFYIYVFQYFPQSAYLDE